LGIIDADCDQIPSLLTFQALTLSALSSALWPKLKNFHLQLLEKAG